MSETGSRDATQVDHPPYLWALGAWSAVLALDVLTLGPTTQLWDAGEYIVPAYIMGIHHPPGNPLFVVLAKAWTLFLSPLGLRVPRLRYGLLSQFPGIFALGVRSPGGAGWGLFAGSQVVSPRRGYPTIHHRAIDPPQGYFV